MSIACGVENTLVNGEILKGAVAVPAVYVDVPRMIAGAHCIQAIELSVEKTVDGFIRPAAGELQHNVVFGRFRSGLSVHGVDNHRSARSRLVFASVRRNDELVRMERYPEAC